MISDIRDVKAPVDIPPNYLWLWVALGILVAIGLGVLVYIWLKKPAGSKKEEQTEPALPPWEKAYQLLNRLEHKKLLVGGHFKLFYSELSDIARHYLEERFALRAPEMTTEEFLESLKTSPSLNEVQQNTLKEFLIMCDMVKFAKHVPSAFEAQKSFELIKQLVDQTRGI